MGSFKTRLYLRAFVNDDLSFINKLRTDESVFALTCGNKYYISSERDKKWLEDKIFNNNTQLYLMLCTIEEKIPIGYICAINIDYINRKAEWGGIIIDEVFSGNGYGVEGARLLLWHLFAELGMNMVYGFWRADHVVSLRMGEKVGFQKSGLLRSFVYKQNKFHDAYLLTILKSEFETNLNDYNKI